MNRTGSELNSHHAGGGSGRSGADHQVGDAAAPVIAAVSIGEEGQSGLLQQSGGVGGCKTHNSYQKVQTH